MSDPTNPTWISSHHYETLPLTGDISLQSTWNSAPKMQSLLSKVGFFTHPSSFTPSQKTHSVYILEHPDWFDNMVLDATGIDLSAPDALDGYPKGSQWNPKSKGKRDGGHGKDRKELKHKTWADEHHNEKLPVSNIHEKKAWDQAPKMQYIMDRMGWFTEHDQWTQKQKDFIDYLSYRPTLLMDAITHATGIDWDDPDAFKGYLKGSEWDPGSKVKRDGDAELYPGGLDPAIFEGAKEAMLKSMPDNSKLGEKLDDRTRASLEYSMLTSKYGLGPISPLVGPLLGGLLTGPLAFGALTGPLAGGLLTGPIRNPAGLIPNPFPGPLDSVMAEQGAENQLAAAASILTSTSTSSTTSSATPIPTKAKGKGKQNMARGAPGTVTIIEKDANEKGIASHPDSGTLQVLKDYLWDEQHKYLSALRTQTPAPTIPGAQNPSDLFPAPITTLPSEPSQTPVPTVPSAPIKDWWPTEAYGTNSWFKNILDAEPETKKWIEEHRYDLEVAAQWREERLAHALLEPEKNPNPTTKEKFVDAKEKVEEWFKKSFPVIITRNEKRIEERRVMSIEEKNAMKRVLEHLFEKMGTVKAEEGGIQKRDLEERERTLIASPLPQHPQLNGPVVLSSTPDTTITSTTLLRSTMRSFVSTATVTMVLPQTSSISDIVLPTDTTSTADILLSVSAETGETLSSGPSSTSSLVLPLTTTTATLLPTSLSTSSTLISMPVPTTNKPFTTSSLTTSTLPTSTLLPTFTSSPVASSASHHHAFPTWATGLLSAGGGVAFLILFGLLIHTIKSCFTRRKAARNQQANQDIEGVRVAHGEEDTSTELSDVSSSASSTNSEATVQRWGEKAEGMKEKN